MAAMHDFLFCGCHVMSIMSSHLISLFLYISMRIGGELGTREPRSHLLTGLGGFSGSVPTGSARRPGPCFSPGKDNLQNLFSGIGTPHERTRGQNVFQ